MSEARVVTRFAPSPTGYLHLGHAYSALLNFDQAQAAGGKFVLRIEDIDQQRCRPEYEVAIFDDLKWLGIHWDGLPLRQSERFGVYEAQLSQLHNRGLIYRCFRTRKDIEDSAGAPHGAPLTVFRSAPLAALEERDKLAEGLPFAWRLSLSAAEESLGSAFQSLSYLENTGEGLVEKSANPCLLGDVVLGRKDSGTSYHLSSILDDAEQGVSHVTRGEDLNEAAGLHVLLHRLMGLTPPIYRHHRLILDSEGKRLAKRDKAATLRHLRETGITSEEVRARLFPT